MKTVKIENGIVCETIPTYALPVEAWYGTEFASSCVAAPDEVQERWSYQNGVFAPPSPHVPTTAEQIAVCKAQLSDTDYKIIKCSEYQIAGITPPPYEIGALHQARQTLRDQINTLETGQGGGKQ